MNRSEKIRTREELGLIVAELRSGGKKVGFTSGVFDLIHPGHVAYLTDARSKCDVLVVGINADTSVREYKGASRPFVSEKDRASVVAGLESVDYVFIFSERRNAENIRALVPDLYIKAGDYSEESMTSASVIKELGGDICIIPFEKGYSTTALLEKIVELHAPGAHAIEINAGEKRPIAFIDRDGVINTNVEYLHEPDKFELIPGALEGMKLLEDRGFRIVVVTNQSGIGLGYFSKEDFYRVNRKLLKLANAASLLIDRVYFCPHSKADKCVCRKPEPGMLLRGLKELNGDPAGSCMIGDTTADLKAGKSAGCKTVLVRTGHSGEDKEFDLDPDHIADDLLRAAKWIIAEE